jgi:exopolyphosphatase/guanosine-5'-triphosphate,3'-diphosphate pyrophosphatase
MKILNKVAIVELGTTSIKLILAHVLPSEAFVVFDEVSEPINLAEDMDNDGIIKSPRIREVVGALKTCRALCDAHEITEVVAVTTKVVREAKNQKSFLDEIYNQTGFSFKVLSEEEQLKSIYTAIINSVDVPKGLIVDISNSSIQLIQYNRRTILNQAIIDYGALNLAEKFAETDLSAEDRCDQMINIITKELNNLEWVKQVEPEYKIIGVGINFENTAKISQKISKYPIDKIHMYEMNAEKVSNVFDRVKPLIVDKDKKVKGISQERADVLASSASIIYSIIDYLKIEQIIPEDDEDVKIYEERKIVVSKNGLMKGLLFNKTVPITQDKPIADILGFSLATISEYYHTKPNNDEHVYNLSMILFKQLKVLHKLSRSYVRVLRAASSMYSSGKRISFTNYTKNGFCVVLNSNINGLTHKELVLASFVVSSQNLDDLKATEWVKYKDLVTKDDIIAVQRLAVIVKIASSLDRFMKKRVIDVNCDILGDSVIMKTILDGKAVLEIREAIKNAPDFKKAFNKSLEIL